MFDHLFFYRNKPIQIDLKIFHCVELTTDAVSKVDVHSVSFLFHFKFINFFVTSQLPACNRSFSP